MSHARFFLASEPDFAVGVASSLPLTAEDSRHAARVLRIGPGELIDVVTPSGIGWRVEVTQVTRDAIAGQPLEKLEAVRQPHVTLFQGVAKGDKMDSIVRQAVEVGATSVVPVLTARTIVRLDSRKRAERGERWRRIAESAAKQARRESMPLVSDPVELGEAAELLGGYGRTLVLWEDADRSRLLLPALQDIADGQAASLALFVGPEGGLTAEEVAVLVAAGGVPVSFGPSVLRTETAAVVALGMAVAVGYGMIADDVR